MRELVAVLLGGVSLSAIYALLAIGLSLIYGVSRILNYSYGSFFTWAAYCAWFLFSVFAWLNYPIAFIAVIGFMFLFGLVVERGLIRPLRWKPDWQITTILVTIALALTLDNIALYVFGGLRKSLPKLVGGTIEFGGFTMGRGDVVVLVAAVVAVIILGLFLKKTRIGMSMRAVAQDMVGAQIVGIPVNKVFSYTFAISAVLAGIAAILISHKHFIYPTAGWHIFIKAFIIVIFGGIGSMWGTLCAAFILGIAEAVVGWQVGLMWVMPFWFVILMAGLIVKPTGLFGAVE